MAGTSSNPVEIWVVMKSLSRGMPLSLMAIPTSHSVPSISPISRWMNPLDKAVFRALINSGSGGALGSLLDPILSPSYEDGFSNSITGDGGELTHHGDEVAILQPQTRPLHCRYYGGFSY